MASRVTRRDVLQAGVAGAGLWLGGVPLAPLLRRASEAPGEPLNLPANANPASEDDLAYLTIAEASRLIEDKRLSPVELLDACLRRIDRHDNAIKAWITVLGDQARREARAAADRAARGSRRSALDGIPIGQKDLYDVAGVRTSAGSQVLADARPAKRNATVVARLERAGAVFMGKLNTHEFAYGVWTPPTSNPWDTTRIPGGSSGGSAAALAAGMCLGASGSDTGGSIRIPSSLCNTVGIKPTFGRVGKFGVVPLSWSLDHAGPLCRSVEDCALILNAIAGWDRNDPTSAAVPAPDFTRGLNRGIKGMTIGVPTHVFFDGVDPQTERLVRKAALKLESLGARIADLKVPETQRISGTAFLLIVLSEALAAHEHYLRRRPHDYQTQTQALLALGAQGHAQNYLRAQRVRSVNIVEWLKRFDKVDAVLTPTTPRPAPTKEEAQATGVFELINYTASFDFNGCPSISVPAGLTDEGLPVGIMLSGPPFGEARLLRIAYAYQEATGFNRKRAPLEP